MITLKKKMAKREIIIILFMVALIVSLLIAVMIQRQKLDNKSEAMQQNKNYFKKIKKSEDRYRIRQFEKIDSIQKSVWAILQQNKELKHQDSIQQVNTQFIINKIYKSEKKINEIISNNNYRDSSVSAILRSLRAND